LLTRIGEDGTRTSFTYDSVGWIRSVQAPNLGITTYQFDDAQSANVIDPLGNTTTIVFDTLRSVTQVTAPGVQPLQVVSSRVLADAIIQPSGARTTYLYESATAAMPRLSVEQTADGRTTYLYASGSTSLRPVAIVNRNGFRTTTTWNSTQKSVVVNALGQRVTNVLDSQLRRLSSIDPLGIRTSVVYDSVGQVAASVNPLGQRTSFSYQRGQRLRTVNAAGAITTSIYDRWGDGQPVFMDQECRALERFFPLERGPQPSIRKGSSPRQLMPRGSELPMPTTLQQIAYGPRPQWGGYRRSSITPISHNT
jgi:YD repeat-containing protein